MKITQEKREIIINMIKTKSSSEVAAIIGCSRKTVWKVLRDNKIQRSAREKAAIRSRIRADLVRAERRRAIFGLDQKTDLKVFSNKERNSLKVSLRRKGYRFPDRGVNVAYIYGDTSRNYTMEERGRKLGILFMDMSDEKITI